jgi:tripartite-type tricarboxylate transporter receptor subunit TctC
VKVVIENRPGAAGLIAADAVLRAPPDGNTLLFTTPDWLVVTPHLRKLAYDPLVDFEPVCKLVDTPPVIVVNNTSTYRSIAEFIEGARSKPGDFTIASVGPGGTYHIAVEMLKRAAGACLIYVPYPGSARAINALLGRHVTAVLAAYPNTAEQIRAGQLRALAAATRTRAEGLADVPTAAEYGYTDFALDVWFGVIAPAKTPKQAILQLSEWFSAAMRISEVREKLVTLGLYPSGTCGSDFGALLRQQSDHFGHVIREANIKAE